MNVQAVALGVIGSRLTCMH